MLVWRKTLPSLHFCKVVWPVGGKQLLYDLITCIKNSFGLFSKPIALDNLPIALFVVIVKSSAPYRQWSLKYALDGDLSSVGFGFSLPWLAMTHAKQSDFWWNASCSEAEENYKKKENISIAAYTPEMRLPLIGVASSIMRSGNYRNSRITAEWLRARTYIYVLA